LAFASIGGTLQHGVRSGDSAAHQRLRRVLVAAEVALAFVLVVAGGLLLRSFVALSRTDPGFRSEGVLTATVTLPSARYNNVAATAFFGRMSERVRTIPGVRDAGFTSDVPWTGYDDNTSFGIAGRQFPQNQGPEARYHFVTPGFLRAISLPLIAGRDVLDSDRRGAPTVVLINDSLARQYWKSAEDAIGARLSLWGSERTVIGVIGDIRDTPWTERVPGALYFPQAQEWYSQDMTLVVRRDADPASLVEPVRRALRDLDPGLPLARVRTLDDVAAEAFATRRFTLLLVATFAGMAVFLSIVGIYGVMAQAVGQRVREFGVRQALGAQPADILRLVCSSGAIVGAVGIAAGAAGSLIVTPLMTSLLYRVDPLDGPTFAAVGLLLMSVALGASYVPARRATRIDPARVLRAE
jgi:predicted permease